MRLAAIAIRPPTVARERAGARPPRCPIDSHARATRPRRRSGGAQDAEQIWPGFSAHGLDHEDILIAQAPKPVRVLATTADFFPIEGTRRSVARTRRLYALLGAGDAIDLVEDESDHRFTDRLARSATDLFARHLLGRPADDDAPIAPLPPERLRCTPTGQLRDAFPDARDPHHECRDGLAAAERGRRAGARDPRPWIADRVRRERRECPLNLRIFAERRDGAVHAEAGMWWSLDDLPAHGLLLRAASRAGEVLPATIALWRGGTRALAEHEAWLTDALGGGRAVLVLDASGMGPCEPYGRAGRLGRLHKPANDLLFLGDDLASLRAWDCLRAVAALAAWRGVDPRDLRGYAHGVAGMPLRVAALIEPRLAREDAATSPSFADLVGERLYDGDDVWGSMMLGALARFDLGADPRASPPRRPEPCRHGRGDGRPARAIGRRGRRPASAAGPGGGPGRRCRRRRG